MIGRIKENKHADLLTSVNSLTSLTNEDMSMVNWVIHARASSHVDIIPAIARHLISSGGKRLRPMITLAAARMFGYTGESHIKLAAAVEFMHTATLLHDDVVDESKMRRGKSTARTLWGNQASVLVGDFLLGQAFQLMIDSGSFPCLNVLSRTATIIAEGEVMQLAAARRITITEEQYFAVISAKTAALFSAAAEVGPIIADGNDKARRVLSCYGANLGLAFQLVDDALDYGGKTENMGKNIGDDFREGKITMPVILSFSRGTTEERLFWKEAMEENKNDEQALAKACALTEKYGSIAATLKKARHFGENARRALLDLDDNLYQKALLDVVDFCISRIN